jgi:hypothetical protein
MGGYVLIYMVPVMLVIFMIIAWMRGYNAGTHEERCQNCGYNDRLFHIMRAKPITIYQ